MSNLTDGELKLIIPSVNDDIKQTIGVDLGNNFTKIDDGVSEINSNITNLKGDINISNTKLDDKIDTVESNTKTNRDKINLVETDVKDSQDKISILSTKVKPETPLNTTSQDLSSAVNEVKWDLDEHKGKYESNETILRDVALRLPNGLKNELHINSNGDYELIKKVKSYIVQSKDIIVLSDKVRVIKQRDSSDYDTFDSNFTIDGFTTIKSYTDSTTNIDYITGNGHTLYYTTNLDNFIGLSDTEITKYFLGKPLIYQLKTPETIIINNTFESTKQILALIVEMDNLRNAITELGGTI